MKSLPAILLMIFFVFGCTNTKSDKERRKINDLWVEAEFRKDSSIHGEANFYDERNKLVYKRNYYDGKESGISYSFYPDGKIHEETAFYLGSKLGYHTVYDSSGIIDYRDYFFYSKQMGPIVQYRNKMPKAYYFTNFEGESLLYVEYDSLGKVSKREGEFITMHVSDVQKNEEKKTMLFLYTPFPPGLNVSYKVGLMKDGKNVEKTILDIPNGQVFFEQILDMPPKGRNYCIVLHIQDSVSAINQLIVKEIIL
jgi:hypothetical protein